MSKAAIMEETEEKKINELENEIQKMEKEKEKTTNYYEEKTKALENKIKEMSSSKKGEIDENEKYLLLNGIVVTLKMANPDYQETSYSVSQLYNSIKKDNVPLTEWPLYIAGKLGVE